MKSDKSKWFKEAIKANAWKRFSWIYRAFMVTKLVNAHDAFQPGQPEPKHMDLFQDSSSDDYAFYDREKNEFIRLEGHKTTSPLLWYDETFELNAGECPNLKENVTTTYGIALFNLLWLVHPFGDKFNYINGEFKPKKIQDMIVDAANNTDPNKPTVTPDEINKWKDIVLATASLSPIAVPTADRNSLTISKKVLEERDRLLKENKDKLTDAAVVADIEKQLIDLDTSLNKGALSEKFYGPASKLRNMGRKRQFIMYGLEGGLDGDLKCIPNSLNEGLNFELTTVSADTITAASASRGLLTAQGGELVKYNLRMFQNSAIRIDDCGTKKGIVMVVNDFTASFLVNRYAFINGKTTLLNKDNLKGLMGKTITVRSPGYCLAPDRDMCKHCTDANLSRKVNGIAVAVGATTNVIMQNDMKAMHGQVNTPYDFNLSEHLS